MHDIRRIRAREDDDPFEYWEEEIPLEPGTAYSSKYSGLTAREKKLKRELRKRKRIREQDLALMDDDDRDGVQDLICPYCGTLAARVDRFFDGTGTIEVRCWYCMGIVSEEFGETYPVVKGFTAD